MMSSSNLFNILGRYFWLVCLSISAYQYVVGIRALASRNPTDPRASAEAIALRRWFLVVSDLPWIVMGWAILIGGVPNIWYFFRPQDQNPYVLTWFATLFLISFAFAFWVFFRGGARNSGTDVKPGEVFCGDCADMGGGVDIARLVDRRRCQSDDRCERRVSV
jgi:hypothetical protein